MADLQDKIDNVIRMKREKVKVASRLVYARSLEVEWPNANERSVPMNKPQSSSARYFALVRISSWRFHDAVPVIMPIAWFGGVLVSFFFAHAFSGGWPVAFALGFTPIILLFLIFWPDNEKV
jgi:hypothetical protein